ncbi:MAG TPA: sigma-70 family RNA polymerase sigma factor [Solirubrobacter sp.]|nr:sigma-70 family RNA polymerase sigma factor [Solirubrobacter sp.]
MTAPAELLVERDYERLKPGVLRSLRRRMAARGLHADETDLDAFYNQAWHGLYVRLVAGDEIASPQGLLVTIAERRAIDEARASRHDRREAPELLDERGDDVDLEARLDDHVRFRQFTQGLRERLTERERQAALLCYVHEYTRPEAAQVLGVSPRRMEKIMDRVSVQTGALVRDIEAGAWCESRRSLIKAYALGLLDVDGPRHALAVAHLEDCPACRRRVRGIRGLASFAPPAPLLLAVVGGAAAAAGQGAAVGGAASGHGAGFDAAGHGAASGHGAGHGAAGGHGASAGHGGVGHAEAGHGAAGHGAEAGRGAAAKAAGGHGAESGRWAALKGGASGHGVLAAGAAGTLVVVTLAAARIFAASPEPPAASASATLIAPAASVAAAEPLARDVMPARTARPAPTPRARRRATAKKPRARRAPKPAASTRTASAPATSPPTTSTPPASPPPARPAPTSAPPRDHDGAGEFELR